MSHLNCIFLGDLHLGKNERYFGLKRGLDYSLRILDDVTQYAREHGIRDIFQLGDVTEDPYPHHTILSALVKRLHKHRDLAWHFIMGNHDYDDADSYSLELPKLFVDLRALKNVTIYTKPALVKIDGIPFYMMPYPFTKPVKTKEEKLILAHLEMRGAKRDNGLVIKDEGQRLPKRDHWVIGHLHTPQRLSRRAIFVGTTKQENFGEGQEKGFLHSRIIKQGHRLKVKHRFIKYTPPYLLQNLIVKHHKDLKQIKKDSLLLYKVFLKDGVDLPHDWREHHPNVVAVQGWNSRKSLADAQQEQITLEDVAFDAHNPKDHLPHWLAAHGYQDKRFIQCTLKLADLASRRLK